MTKILFPPLIPLLNLILETVCSVQRQLYWIIPQASQVFKFSIHNKPVNESLQSQESPYTGL